jgi:hypothetical protein
MGLLTTIKRKSAVPETLDEALVDLCRYGKPKLSMMDGGWYCWIQMHVAAQGATFEIKSEFGHASPSSAVHECRERILTTIEQLGHDHDA